MDATALTPSTVEFTGILVKSTLPLHPYLVAHPRLSVAVVEGEEIHSETPVVNCDLATGIWEINSSLCVNSVKQSVTLAVLANNEGLSIRIASVKLSLEELLTRIKARPDGYQEFNIVNASSSIQLLMTCIVKSAPSFVVDSTQSQVVTGANNPVDIQERGRQLDVEPEHAGPLSREDLESFYARAIQIPDQEMKARGLSLLGFAYRAHYQETRTQEDLGKAISMYEEAMHFTGPAHPQLAEHAHSLATVLKERFHRGRDPDDIERAILYYQTAVSSPEDLNADKPRRLSNLGTALQLRFQHFGDLADLEKAIFFKQEAVKLRPNEHPDAPILFSNLGNALQSRFSRLGTLLDLNNAISNHRMAVKLTPHDHPHKAALLVILVNALQSRFERLDRLADLENVVSNQRKVVELTPDGHPDKPRRLSTLASALQSRFSRLGNIEDIDDAVLAMQTAVELSPDGHPDRPDLLNNHGNALRSSFQHVGSLPDLENAISTLRKAIENAPDGHRDKPDLFSNVGAALYSRFQRLGHLADMDDAIWNFRQAVGQMPDDHSNKPTLFNNYGTALQSRFERFGNLADLEGAISSLRLAVTQMPDGHIDKAALFSNLGNALLSRFEHVGCLADLEDAISSHSQAVQITPDDHPSKPRLLNNFAMALQSHFEHVGMLADLQNVISSLRPALEQIPDSHADKPALFSNLGNALRSRFEHVGSLTDLEDAISSHLRAIQLTPDGHPSKPGLFNNLGLALRLRFERLGSVVDIDEAIRNEEKAVELTPDGHPDKPEWMNNFGGPLDLENAVSNFRKAVELTPDGHPGKPGLFNNLGLALRSRFECLGDPTDVDEATRNNQNAVELTPDGHPEKPSRLNNLGVALQSRFKHLGNLTDMDEGISNFQTAVELTPDGHPDKPTRLKNLGIAYLSRFRRIGIPSDLEKAFFAISTAANSTVGSAITRFKAARSWAELCEEHSRSPLDAFSCAIDLLPRVAWLGLAVTDQHALLADVGGLVRDAVAAAIRYEEYETAVVWAEQGRSIVWQNLLGLRSPVDNLRETRPELADRLQSIARQLEGSGTHGIGLVAMSTPPAGYVSCNDLKLAIQWDELVNEIRKIPKFEDFLRAKTFVQLAPAAHEGPVVILNLTDSQCDALVIIADNSSEVRVFAVNIPLERFSHEKSKTLFKTLTDLLDSAGFRQRNDRKSGRARSTADGEAKLKLILRILWQEVVKPVIESLAFQTELKRPPRIWWCATGLLAFLPIHAAGLYDTHEIGEKVSDYVISSYTPTLSAILKLSDPVVQEDFQVLTVAQALASGAQPIPKTEDEVEIVQSLTASAKVLNLVGRNATVERVQEGMMESNWIHLACHGQQHPTDPMKSGFLLHDRTLELSEIVKMSLPKADFAFLSACQTATGDEKVAEESVHLAAGMFLSGCRGVIATTWSIRDDDGPMIAKEVYGWMFKDGKPQRKEAAYALHEAVRRLRESGAQCTSWVLFIHIGR